MNFKEKSQKQLQVAEQVRREIANIFLRDDIFKDKNITVTIFEADVSPDLKNAKIFLSIFAPELDETKILKELNVNNYYFRKKLSQAVKLRNVPEIRFVLDKSLQNAIEIESKLNTESKNIPASDVNSEEESQG